MDLIINDGKIEKFEGVTFSSKKVADAFFERFLQLERYESIEEVRKKIKECEGKHIQQISYSSYHDSLTQVCFGCMRVRTSMNVKKEKIPLKNEK